MTITSHAYKLFPIFVWEERFRPLWGKQPVPAMRDLYSTGVQTISNCFISLGTAGTAAGVIANYLPAITFFQGVVIIGVGAFLLNFFTIARWSLLKKSFRPTVKDWENFHLNFPDVPLPPDALHSR